MYLLFAVPGMLLAFWAQMKVKSTFAKYSQVSTRNGASGAEIARKILDSNGLQHVKVERVEGFLSDHYDPRDKTLRLSPPIYDSNSVAAFGVAAHEAGHAIQDQVSYGPLRMRSTLVPISQFGSTIAPWIFMGGMMLSSASKLGTTVALAGIVLFAAAVAFTLVTLPVEFDASKRAKEILLHKGMVSKDEAEGVEKVLDAAAWTYIAAAVGAIMTLIYYIFTFLGRREE